MNRLRIRHVTGFHYAGEVTASYNEARMLPASSEGQLVLYANLEILPISSTHSYVDYWGTRVSSFEILTPHSELSLTATSLVEVRSREHPEHRQQHLPAVRRPVDVEPAGERRAGTVAQHLPQRRVEPFGGRHRHVVGHDVQHQAQAVRHRGAGQRPQPLLAAQLLAHPGVVHHVVAVRGAGHRLQHRGQVQMGDPEIGQIGDGPLGGGERADEIVARRRLDDLAAGGAAGPVRVTVRASTTRRG